MTLVCHRLLAYPRLMPSEDYPRVFSPRLACVITIQPEAAKRIIAWARRCLAAVQWLIVRTHAYFKRTPIANPLRCSHVFHAS